jgi:LacI family transcriptional regulator
MTTGDATIYDVARQAGVSISTVSLAINHPGRVRPATRERVHAAADALGFVPKEQAVARAKRGVGRIAVVAPFSHYPSFYRRLTGVLAEAGPQGASVIVYDHEDAAELASPLLAALPIRGHVDGLIAMGLPLSDAVATRLAGRLPTVLIDAEHPEFPSVTVDYFGAGVQVGRHLLELGHQRVATLMGSAVSVPPFSQTSQRLSGFGSVFAPGAVQGFTVDRRLGGGADGFDQVFPDGIGGPDRVTALLAEWDLPALRFITEARARGLGVPTDISVVGFDDGPMSKAAGLTTVTQPLEETGATGMGLLRRLMAGERPHSVQFDLTLAIRDTTGPRASA